MKNDIENLIYLEGITNVLEEHHEQLAEEKIKTQQLEDKVAMQMKINIGLAITLIITLLLGVFK